MIFVCLYLLRLVLLFLRKRTRNMGRRFQAGPPPRHHEDDDSDVDDDELGESLGINRSQVNSDLRMVSSAYSKVLHRHQAKELDT